MTPIVPTLGKDRLLTITEGLKEMEKRKVAGVLMKLVEKKKVRVWLCEDGQLRFQAEVEA